jgi:cell division protein FtsB
MIILIVIPLAIIYFAYLVWWGQQDAAAERERNRLIEKLIDENNRLRGGK